MGKGRNKLFSILQRIGKSLMIPVSVLPAAGLLVALGRLLQNFAETANGEISNQFIHGFGQLIFSGGLAIFEQLPVIFAIGVAIGFAAGEGVAGLSAVVGYFTMNNVINAVGNLRGLEMSINTGVFGGIVIGLLAARLYKRYFQTKLHPVLGFFSGKRLVPIVTAGASLIVGVLFGFIWPPIQVQINAFGSAMMDSTLGPAFYAAGKRLLIPVGLHHVYYPPFLYEFGEFVTKSGEILRGETARYFAGDPTAGRFMASEFPIMLFGLPAATLAMYLRAEKKQKKAVAGIMLSAALTSIITGITEPIEFTFIFVAPILYVFHIVAAFISGLLTSYFDIRLGYTFSASLIDYVVGFFNQKNSIYLFTVVGPIIFSLYFGVFYWLIKLMDIKTPGREEEDNNFQLADISISDKAREIVTALGGVENIDNIDSCITRIRLTVHETSQVDKGKLKKLGSAGILDAGGGNFQIIFGTESEQLNEEIRKVMSMKVKKQHLEANDNSKFNLDDKAILLKSPIKGKIVKIEEVPDDIFSQKLVGDGIAIEPFEGVIYSPVEGKVVQLFKTNHAIGIETENGIEILIHIGIDTIKMGGKGFEALVSQGDTVKTGDKLIQFDIELIKREAKSIITPIIITNAHEIKKIEILKEGNVFEREDLMKVIK